jgi:hypothetical protein
VARTVVRPNPEGIIALHRFVARIHVDVVDDIRQDAERYAPVRTGEMRRTIHHRLLRPLLSHVVVDSDHWQPVEYGAAPHDIVASPGSALFWPDAPHPVYIVHHPGNAAQPFMRPALYTRRSLIGRPYR